MTWMNKRGTPILGNAHLITTMTMTMTAVFFSTHNPQMGTMPVCQQTSSYMTLNDIISSS